MKPEKMNNKNEMVIENLMMMIIKNRKLILYMTLTFSIIGTIVSFQLPDVYKSSVTLAPAGDQSGQIPLQGQLGGLASLAGLDIGATGDNKTTIALAILESKSFKMQFINKYNLLPYLLAAERWDIELREIIFDQELYDDETNSFIISRDSEEQMNHVMQEGVLSLEDIMEVRRDKERNLVEVTLRYISPEITKKWLDLLIDDLNQYMRKRDQQEANRSIAYLNKQLELATLSEVKRVLFELIEEQTKKLMFTEVRSEYIFEIIDPPIVPADNDGPNRALFVFVSTVFGLILSFFLIVYKSMRVKE